MLDSNRTKAHFNWHQKRRFMFYVLPLKESDSFLLLSLGCAPDTFLRSF